MQLKTTTLKFWMGTGAIVMLAGMLIYALFFGNLRPQSSLPSSITCALRMDNWKQARLLLTGQKNSAWTEVFKSAMITGMLRDLDLVEKLMRKNAVYNANFTSKTLFAGFTMEEADDLHALFILECPDAPSLEAWLKTSDAGIRVFPSLYGNHTVYTVLMGKNDKFVFAKHRNLLLFSRFSYRVEEALDAGNSSHNWWGKRRAEIPDSKAGIQFFIRTANFPALYHNKMAAQWQFFPTWMARQMDWIGVAWDGKKVDLLGSSKTLSSLYKNGREVARDSVFAILPDNTALLAWTGLSAGQQPLKSWIDGGNADFRRFVSPWLKREAAYVITQPNVQTMHEDQCLVLGFEDEPLVAKTLDAYGKTRGLVRKRTYNTFDVWEFLHNDFLHSLLGDNIDAFRNPVVCMLGKYVVVAPSVSTLEVWVDKYVINQTMAGNTDYLQLRQNLAANSHGMVLFDAAVLPMMLQNMMKQPAAKTTDIAAFGKLGLLSVDVTSAAGNRIIFSPVLQKTGASQEREASILWKTALKAPARSAPGATGLEGQDKFIFVQDQRNEMYCMDQGGNIRWRRQFSGPVLSEVKAIDFYNNQNACFLFNTAEQIWIVDEKGADIEGYPLKLQSSATNGVLVTDFDASKKYHFFVACDNGNLYGYDQYGRPLPGWNPKSGVGDIQTQMQHFVHQNKDYLVVLSTHGKLSVFARNGATRFPPVQLEGTFKSAPQCDAHPSVPRITCANTAGNVVVVNLEGKQFDILKTSISAGMGPYFVFTQLQGDARFDYAAYNGKQLTIKGYDGKTLKTWSSQNLVDGGDVLFDAGSSAQLGILSSKKRKIWLVNGQGKIHHDFPLAGSTAFTLAPLRSGDKKPVLLVGNGASVYAYLVK
ncbi:MAG: hypothetical protein IT270_07620 [Saprospiraceae bacterium]|nr:hypothetical protein [Saprospiraceae bacterium]